MRGVLYIYIINQYKYNYIYIYILTYDLYIVHGYIDIRYVYI